MTEKLEPFVADIEEERERRLYEERRRHAYGEIPPRPGGFLPIDASWLKDEPVPERRNHVEGMMPPRNVTLFSGDGGIGKSLLLQQLCACTVLGRPWLGRRVLRPGPAIFLSAEDEMDELHARLDDISHAMGSNIGQMTGLTLLSLVGEDAVLGAPSSKGVIQPTDRFRQLAALVRAVRPTLIGLDTAADLFGGNEINRSEVRQFIGLLRKLGISADATVVLLSHPSVAGMQSGTGLSGSTAWNSSVRYRLYMDRPKDDGVVIDPDVRIIRSMKANYGPPVEDFQIKWEHGAFRPVGGPSHTVRLTEELEKRRADDKFLALLADFNAKDRLVGENAGKNYAPAKFEADPRAGGVTSKGFEGAMARLLADGRVVSRPIAGAPPSKADRKFLFIAEGDDKQ